MGMGVEELSAPLEILPPVEFCCAYGSSLLPNNTDKEAMVDYILGVSDPVQWHSENFERNKHHYSSLMAYLGPKAVAQVADRVGVGVHFNPFVHWKGRMLKYGVIRIEDLARDILTWDRFYLSGRLQKPVLDLVDKYNIRMVNVVNLKAAAAAALIILPREFTEEELYCKICSLSYMGDLRMLFAEDKNKVKKIVQGNFSSFQSMYMPIVREYIIEGLLKSSSHNGHNVYKQDCGLSATHSLFSSLPYVVQSYAVPKSERWHEKNPWMGQSRERVNGQVMGGGLNPQFNISSKEEAANCTRRALRRVVMVSSARQAVSGLLAAGGANALRYLGKKIAKAWRSRTS